MSHIETLEDKIKAVEPIKSKFSFRYGRSYSRPPHGRNSITLQQTAGRSIGELSGDHLQDLVTRWLVESLNNTTRKFEINTEDTYDKCISYVNGVIRNLVLKLSPAKKPKLTKVYKKIDQLAAWKTKTEPFLAIWLYYVNNKSEIETDPTCVHGKNIFALLTNVSMLA